ncbi:MAG: M23 family metallopeptidase [Pseudomonadota bacterium]
MKIIFIGDKQASQSLQFTQGMAWLLSGLGVLLLVSLMGIGAFFGYVVKSQMNKHDMLFGNNDSIDVLAKQSEEYVSVLAGRVAELQARMVRLDALGERLTKGADLDDGEFNFKSAPAQGGSDDNPDDIWVGQTVDSSELESMIVDLNRKIDDREQQLRILDGFMANQYVPTRKEVAKKQVSFNQYLLGLPVKGRISSNYGYRIHPVTGRRKMHKGIDIAAGYHTSIVAPAPGVVTFSGWKGGYGKSIDIDHGNGLVTRYAHNSRNIVKKGDVVRKGDLIGRVGSTGRSTGPHLHFEVIKDSRAVNPKKYLSKKHL